jgi:hypothetical protein
VGSAIFEKKVATWLADDFNWFQRVWRGAAGLYHNRVPRTFRPIGMAHSASRTALASSGPAVAYYYGSVPGVTATIAGVGIFCAHAFVGFLDKIAQGKQKTAEDPHGEIIIRLGDLLKHTSSKAAARDRDEAIRACLGILENFAREIVKAKKGDLSVSLVLYQGSSRSRMNIRHRNPGNGRPIGRDFDATDKIGHRACAAGGEPRVVHDIRWFGREALVSPTQSSVKYRSLMIVPVGLSATGDGPRGFVSIDCEQPYAFYGNRSTVIMVTCEPVFSHLNELIGGA